jgi:GMP synthase-like glutamine amidotransferase
VAAPVLAEQKLLREAMQRDIPILGICFGAQQVAAVLGAEITKAQSPEIGWCQVFATSEAKSETPVALTSGPWMQWHYDRFSVPSGVTVLADSPVGPQAMVVGRTLAVQFHPEATETIVSHWSSGTGAEELDAAGLSKVELLSETRSQVEGAEIRCDELVDWYISTIAQRHMGSPLV